MRMQVLSLALLSVLRIQHCHEFWCSLRYRLDATLLWLWCRLAAVAPIQPLAWEPPLAMGVVLKRQKQKNKKKPPKTKKPAARSLDGEAK